MQWIDTKLRIQTHFISSIFVKKLSVNALIMPLPILNLAYEIMNMVFFLLFKCFIRSLRKQIFVAFTGPIMLENELHDLSLPYLFC